MKIIGITGARRAGKDTFAQLLTEMLVKNTNQANIFHFAFADRLKEDLDQLFKKQFKVDIFNLNGEIKEKLRPILIAYGCAWRDINENHWVEIVDEEEQFDCYPDFIFIGKDFRFPNEVEYFKYKYGSDFILVEVERIDGVEPTEEEKKHIPEMKKLVDYSVLWPTVGDDSLRQDLNKYVEEFYSKFLNEKTKEIRNS